MLIEELALKRALSRYRCGEQARQGYIVHRTAATPTFGSCTSSKASVLPAWANVPTEAARHLVRCLLDDLKRKLACAQGGDQEPPPLIRRIGLVVTPAAEGHQLIKIEVGAALCPFDHVVDVQAPPYAAGLAAPAGAAQNLRADRSPLGPTGRLTTLGPRASRSHAPTRAQAERGSSSQHGVAPRFCPRGQKSALSSGRASSWCLRGARTRLAAWISHSGNHSRHPARKI